MSTVLFVQGDFFIAKQIIFVAQEIVKSIIP